jgi:hypothetical protein
MGRKVAFRNMARIQARRIVMEDRNERRMGRKTNRIMEISAINV